MKVQITVPNEKAQCQPCLGRLRRPLQDPKLRLGPPIPSFHPGPPPTLCSQRGRCPQPNFMDTRELDLPEAETEIHICLNSSLERHFHRSLHLLSRFHSIKIWLLLALASSLPWGKAKEEIELFLCCPASEYFGEHWALPKQTWQQTARHGIEQRPMREGAFFSS